MARKRKVPAEDSLRQLDGAKKPEPGTYLARRAKAALRANESTRLGADETRERMRFTMEQLEVLDAIAAGLPVRNSREVIAALRLKAEFLLGKPASAVDHRVGFIAYRDPYDDGTEKPALPAAAAAVAVLTKGQAPAGEDKDDEDEEP
jgi:hypothetical protein